MTLRNYGFKFRFQRYSSSVLSWPSDNCFKYLKTRTQGNRALNIDLFQPHNKALKRILFSNLQRNFLLIRCLSISSCTSSKHNNKSCSSLNLFRQTNYRNKATKMSFCTGIVDTTSCLALYLLLLLPLYDDFCARSILRIQQYYKFVIIKMYLLMFNWLFEYLKSIIIHTSNKQNHKIIMKPNNFLLLVQKISWVGLLRRQENKIRGSLPFLS